MRQFYVYELTDMGGITFYIGKGMRYKKYNRITFHKNHWQHNKNKKLVNKIKKLGGIFNTKMLLISDAEKECLNFEVEMIKRIGRCNLCNLTDGGEGICGYHHTRKTKKKMSEEAMKSSRISVARKNLQKAIQKNIGKRKYSVLHNKIVELYKTESILAICKILKLDFSTLKRYLVENNLYTKNKNRKPMSLKTRKKQSLSHIGLLSRPVIQYDKSKNKLREFNTASDASEFIKGIRKYGNYICSCCNGKRKSAFGYIWKYKI